MKAPAFDYKKAGSLDEAIKLLGDHGDDAALIAGGQSLVPALNMRLSAPEILIDIHDLDELRGIKVDKDVVRIGAMTRHYEVLTNKDVKKHIPLFALAMPHVAHEAVRSRGTFGGNNAHADPASEMPACNLVLKTKFTLAGPDGKREVDAEDFYVDLYETALQPDEIMVEAAVPVIRKGYKAGFMELSRRAGDYALTGLACQAKVDGKKVSDVRLGYFGVGNTAVLAKNAAEALEGKEPDGKTLEAAKKALGEDMDPPGDLHSTGKMKLHYAGVLLERVLKDMVGGKK